MESKLTFDQLLKSCTTTYDETEGMLEEKLLEAYDTAIRRAHFYARKSTLTLQLEFVPKDGRMLVTANVSTKTPQPSPLPLTAFVDRDGTLCLEDPRQQKLDFPNVAPIAGVTNAG